MNLIMTRVTRMMIINMKGYLSWSEGYLRLTGGVWVDMGVSG